MKRVAGDERERIVGIPLVVRPAVVRVEPRTVVVPFNVEHLQIAVAIRQRYAKRLPFHHPLMILGVVSYSAS